MIDDIHLFLVHAIQLERDAARQYEDLAQVMGAAGNREVQALFDRMALYSRRHLKEAMNRGGFRELPVLAPGEFQWPEGVSPEAASWQGVDGLIDVIAALELALSSETAGYDFYADIARRSNDPEVGRMAREFASEESAHVRDLQAWIVRMAA
ncbi:ferritin-like domain-containing protein [Variovorax ginsengisoli]|uniref:Rubrerythrin n=1 Tax=Variovorax ginsengisoli TaxID=363844 RepID=A0ABT9SEF8_9BURK|nr:ferritin family protein [Variovorax ginsengisoli]MDP9902754.1 rubrerythrin [Variovorax ginsengisoli]